MKRTSSSFKVSAGFSLSEVLAALAIGAMVLVAVLSVYARVETTTARITHRLDSSQLPFEILQRIAEDLDRIVEGSSDVKITIANKFKEGYQTAKLTIVKTYSDRGNRPKTFEEIIWQTDYDYESDANGLVLYRSYSGIAPEDKLLDEQRASWEKDYPFVPICEGVTFFKIQIPSGDQLSNRWTRDSLPPGITVTISFAEPFETWEETWDVPDVEKITRTIAIDRTRSIRFAFVPAEVEEDGEADVIDANDLTDFSDEIDANDLVDVND